jgi:hypothetical protein
MKSALFYAKNGKFYISRLVIEAAFIQFVGSLRPERWNKETLKARFDILLKNRDKMKDGVFAVCFNMAERYSVDKWVITNVSLQDPTEELKAPPMTTLKVLVKASDHERARYEEIEEFQIEGMDEDDFEDYSVMSRAAGATRFSAHSMTSKQEGCTDLSRSGKQAIDKELALQLKDNIDDMLRRPRFEFSDFNIPIGATLTLFNDENETVEVIDGTFGVQYTGPQRLVGKLKFTPLTRVVMGKRATTNLSPMDYWCYEGVRLRQMYNEKYGNRKKQRYQRTYVLHHPRPVNEESVENTEEKPKKRKSAVSKTVL